MISEVTTENFKCFNSQSISLSNINILTGANGCGKSAIMQSILLFAQALSECGCLGDLEISGGEYIHLGGFDDILKRGSAADYFKVGIKATDNEENDIKITFKKSSLDSTVAEISSFILNGEEKVRLLSDSTGNDPNEVRPIKSVESSTIPVLQYFDKIYYVPADRHVDKTTMSLNAVNKEDANGDDLFHFLVSRKDITKTIVKDASEILSGTLLANEESDEMVSVLMDSVSDSKGYHPINMGDGYRHVLPMLAMLSYVPKESILLVENPEAFLHPSAISRLLKKMIEYAKLKNLQLIMETHSDHIINGAMVAVKENELTPEKLSIYYFERDPNDATSCYGNKLEVRSDGRIMVRPKGFFDQIDIELEMILGF